MEKDENSIVGDNPSSSSGVSGIIANSAYDIDKYTDDYSGKTEETENSEDGHVCSGLDPCTVYKPVVQAPVDSTASTLKSRQKRWAMTAAKHNAAQIAANGDSTSRVTRSRTAHFPLMRLPPEIRNIIYRLSLEKPDRIDARTMLIPSIFCTTALVRKESLGLLTANNEMVFTVRSSYCVTARGPASTNHPYHFQIGRLMLDARRKAWFAQKEIVFKALRLRVCCICCRENTIGFLNFSILNGHLDLTSVEMRVADQYSLTCFFGMVGVRLYPVLRRIHNRSKTQAIRFRDVEELAECCKI